MVVFMQRNAVEDLYMSLEQHCVALSIHLSIAFVGIWFLYQDIVNLYYGDFKNLVVDIS